MILYLMNLMHVNGMEAMDENTHMQNNIIQNKDIIITHLIGLSNINVY